MWNIPNPGNTGVRTRNTAIAIALMISLAACGGGSGDNSSVATNSPGSETIADDSNTTPPTPSTNASFFDSIFLKDTGAGYYQFDMRPTGQGMAGPLPASTGFGRTQYYVNADSDSNFSMASSVIAGNFKRQYATHVYITAEGAFTSQHTPDTDIGANSKIFAKLPQGYELGMQGMSTPLYSVSVNATDVSGQPLSDVLQKDENAYPTGLYLLRDDSTAMPHGAQIYQVPQAVINTYLWLSLSNYQSTETLEQTQARTGGVIQTLGGYRYLIDSSNGRGCNIEYNGTVYSGVLYQAGDRYSAVGAGYNRIAADFIAQRLVAAQGQ